MTTTKGLTAKMVKSISEAGRYHDGGGLYLNVTEAGTKSWIQRITLDGKQSMKGLGSVNKLSLRQARDKAEENRTAVKRGENPFSRAAKRRADIAAVVGTITPTFPVAAKTWFDLNLEKHPVAAKTIWRWLEVYAMPAFDGLTVDEISPFDVAEVINGLIDAGKVPTSKKVRQAIKGVFDWAVAAGHRNKPEKPESWGNPAGENVEALIKATRHQAQSHRYLDPCDVPSAWVKTYYGPGGLSTFLAMRFLILTGARTAEVRGMVWGEIDWESETWRIPAERMKARRPHNIPLSKQALEILWVARGLKNHDSPRGWQAGGTDGEIVFINPTTGKRLAHASLVKRAQQDKLGCVPHGFRTSLTVWADKEGFPKMWTDLSLAHQVGGAVDQAYHRSDLLEERRGMMQAWADFVTQEE